MKFARLLAAKNDDILNAPPVTAAFLGDSVTHGCFECYRDEDGNIQTIFEREQSYAAKFAHIAGMLYSALQYRGAYAAWFRLAALLFVFSDSVIAWGRFVAPVPCRTCVVMITYYAAQYLFYLFAVRAATLSDSPH